MVGFVVCENDVGILGHVESRLSGLSGADGDTVSFLWSSQDESRSVVFKYVEYSRAILRATRDG